jgi:hypothetical protein
VRLRLFLPALAAAAVVAGPAQAAVAPAVHVSATGVGYAKTVTVRVAAPGSGKPVRHAVVRASATMRAPGHFMSARPVRLVERAPGVYRGTLRFVMLGQWVIRVEVAAPSRPAVTSRLTIRL